MDGRKKYRALLDDGSIVKMKIKTEYSGDIYRSFTYYFGIIDGVKTELTVACNHDHDFKIKKHFIQEDYVCKTNGNTVTISGTVRRVEQSFIETLPLPAEAERLKGGN